MPATKITINNNGNIRIEGDFEILDPQGKPFGLAGRTAIGPQAEDLALPALACH